MDNQADQGVSKDNTDLEAQHSVGGKTNSNKDGSATSSPELEAAKQKAMQALVPLIDHLQGVDPETKFDISLKAMRFTDNKDLVNTVLDAAMAIRDESSKAEALVELINEINYLQSS